MIKTYDPDAQMVKRNPEFKEWSADAQPAATRTIAMKIGLPLDEATTQIEQGQADWMYDIPPAGRLGEISSTVRGARCTSIPARRCSTWRSTSGPPFDKPEVRQALNYAVDRDAVIKIFGGPALARPTCQILPPDFPGYQAYCPYTKDPGTEWSAPDMEKAKQLVDASGDQGPEGHDHLDQRRHDEGDRPLLRLAAARPGLRRRHQSLNGDVQYTFVQDSSNKAQMSYSYWFPDYPAGSNFLNVVVGCAGFTENSTSSPNLSGFCDPDIQGPDRGGARCSSRPTATRRTRSGPRSTRRRRTRRRGSRSSSATGWTSSPSGSASTSSTRP